MNTFATDPNLLMQTWLKALGRVDDGAVYWWFTGITHGLTADGGLQPLFRHENFSFGTYHRVSDQRFESVMQDVTFYRDIESGQLLRDFTNPYTNETVPIDEVITKDINNFYDLEGGCGFLADGNEIAQPFAIDVTTVDDLAWMTRVMDWSLPNPLDPEKHAHAYTGPMVRLQMETTLRVELADLSNGAAAIPATSSYEAVTPWFPWLHMGGRDGFLITRAMGKKLDSYDKLPQEVLSAAEQRFPGCVTGEQPPPDSVDPWMGYLKRSAA